MSDIRFSELCDKADARAKVAGDDAYTKGMITKFKMKPFLMDSEINDIIKSASSKPACFDYSFHVVESLNSCLKLISDNAGDRINDGDKDTFNKLSTMETSNEIDISSAELLEKMSEAGLGDTLRNSVKHSEIHTIKEDLKKCNKLISTIGKSDDKTKADNEPLLSILKASATVLTLKLNTYTNAVRVIKYFATGKFES